MKSVMLSLLFVAPIATQVQASVERVATADCAIALFTGPVTLDARVDYLAVLRANNPAGPIGSYPGYLAQGLVCLQVATYQPRLVGTFATCGLKVEPLVVFWGATARTGPLTLAPLPGHFGIYPRIDVVFQTVMARNELYGFSDVYRLRYSR